jgi:hypothetical protein
MKFNLKLNRDFKLKFSMINLKLRGRASGCGGHYIWNRDRLYVPMYYGTRPGPAGTYQYSDAGEDIPPDLIFFSPFEEFRLRTAGIIDSMT